MKEGSAMSSMESTSLFFNVNEICLGIKYIQEALILISKDMLSPWNCQEGLNWMISAQGEDILTSWKQLFCLN